jgi:hypothetical protein
MFNISKTTCHMYLPPATDSEVKPTKFEKHLASSQLPNNKHELLNKATLLGSSGLDSFSFMMKSLWVLSAGKKNHKLRDLVQDKRDCCHNNP